MTSDPIHQSVMLLQQKLESVLDEARRLTEVIRYLESSFPTSMGGGNGTSEGSVRTRTLRLMEEADRDWAAGEILTEFITRGMPLQGASPENAVRSSFVDSLKAGQIIRTTTGRYKSAKWLANSEKRGNS